MTGFKLEALKKTFFDREAILKAEEKATRRNLSKMGAIVRSRSRRLIKKRKEGVYSSPGQPPFGHGEQLLKKWILFGYDAASRSVVVGPTKTNQTFFNGDGAPVTGTVPGILERGGSIRILEVFRNDKWQRADLRSKRRNAGLQTRLRAVVIEKRPYMKPGEEAARADNLQLWKDSIR